MQTADQGGMVGRRGVEGVEGGGVERGEAGHFGIISQVSGGLLFVSSQSLFILSNPSYVETQILFMKHRITPDQIFSRVVEGFPLEHPGAQFDLCCFHVDSSSVGVEREGDSSRARMSAKGAFLNYSPSYLECFRSTLSRAL
ncbi:hypothetical protein BaRGS_00010591 [Batillaria attramentaria]|uniref:Uncharacterized protein n=1 Tax=Batillaria attramentaria TaxID=370345 RepID=A0ABD0LGJ5_9CAEN